MARRVKQFRFYSENDTLRNQPTNITPQKLSSGSVFADYLPIKQLGIQALPGTKFKVNNSSEPIVIGSTGIYELELPDDVEITALSFEASSIAMLSNLENSSLIVDIIYEDGEG